MVPYLISGWRLVFRSTAGCTGVSIYSTWNTDNSVHGVMKLDMIDNWQSISPQNVTTSSFWKIILSDYNFDTLCMVSSITSIYQPHYVVPLNVCRQKLC